MKKDERVGRWAATAFWSEKRCAENRRNRFSEGWTVRADGGAAEEFQCVGEGGKKDTGIILIKGKRAKWATSK